MSAEIDVYGLRARICGWREPVESVRLDFAYFEAREEASRPADVEIELVESEPGFDGLGDPVASFVTPRNVVYQTARGTVIDYFGRAVAVLEREDDRATLRIEGTDEHLVHEAAYLYLLSRIGEHLDRAGLPRLHALALSGAQGAVAVLFPSGGGKSTLALRALQADGVRLIAEDTPLIDKHGYLHPFPLRIGINATDADRLGEGRVRRVERMEFHPKLALEVAAFAERIEREPQPLAHLVIGRRSLGSEASLEPLPARAAAGALLREAVVGVGVYQGMEFVLQHGMRDTARMLPIAATRARSCAAGLRRAKVWQLTAGRDHEHNWAALAPLLED